MCVIEKTLREILEARVDEFLNGKSQGSTFESLFEGIKLERTTNVVEPAELVWSKSRRRVLADMEVGSVKYVARPRRVSPSLFRKSWYGPRTACRLKIGGEWKFYNTETALKIERVA